MKIQATIATLIVALIATAGVLAAVVGGGIFAGEATAIPDSLADSVSVISDAAAPAADDTREADKTTATDEATADASKDADTAPLDANKTTTKDEADKTPTTPVGDNTPDTDAVTDSETADGDTPEGDAAPAEGATSEGDTPADEPPAGDTAPAEGAVTTTCAPGTFPNGAGGCTGISILCIPGFHLEDGECVPTIAPPFCAPGFVLNVDTNECVEVVIAPPLCAPGFTHNIEGDCVSICADGEVYDIDTDTCFEVTIAPPFCAPGFVLTLANECVSICTDTQVYDFVTDTCIDVVIAPPLCIDGHVLNEAADDCIPKTCPPAQFLNDIGNCTNFDFGTGLIFCPPGETLVGDTCIGLNLDPVIVPQVNPELLPDIPETVGPIPTVEPLPVNPALLVPVAPVFVPSIQVPGL